MRFKLSTKKLVLAAIVAAGILFGGMSAAGASDTTSEGCTVVGPVAECSYVATRAADITAIGVWNLTITRGDQIIDLSSHGVFDTRHLEHAVQPGDRVAVRTCFYLCCPWIASVVAIAPNLT